MNFKKVNNITGWAVFLIAFATYFLTREARGSLWDCGEFVASADKMQLPHPPGAPMFTLLGAGFPIMIVIIISAIAGTWVYGAIKDKIPH